MTIPLSDALDDKSVFELFSPSDTSDTDSVRLHKAFACEVEGLDEMMEKRRLLARLIKAANELTDAKGNPNARGREIFLRRLGLHEEHLGEPQSLAEVSEALSVAAGGARISNERVRQLYVPAATDVADSVIAWANGECYLPEGFRKRLVSPGRYDNAAFGRFLVSSPLVAPLPT